MNSRLQQGISKLNQMSNYGSSISRLSSPSMGGSTGNGRNYEELKRQIHAKLVERLDFTRVRDLASDALRRDIRRVVEHLCDTENPLLNRLEREKLIEEILDETLGFGPLEVLLKDPTISDILVNGPYQVYVGRRGKLEKTDVKFRDNDHLLQIIDRIVSKVGRRVDETSPMVDARLPQQQSKVSRFFFRFRQLGGQRRCQRPKGAVVGRVGILKHGHQLSLTFACRLVSRLPCPP